jgi:hypothetical protein
LRNAVRSVSVCQSSWKDLLFSDKVWSDHFIMYFWWVHFNLV